MRRLVLVTAACLGLALIATAFNMAAQHGEEAAVATPEEPGMADRIARSLGTGIFARAPIDARELLPPAPEGFVRTPYTTPAGEAIAGHELMTDRVITRPKGPRDAVLARLASSAEARKLGAAAIYGAPDRRMALRIQASLPAFREAAEGRLSPPFALKPYEFARLDGIRARGFHGYAEDGSLHDLQGVNRLIQLDFRGLVAVEIFADGSITDADIAALLAGLDTAAIHQALPAALPGFVPGAGLTTPEGAVWSGAPVTPPLSFRARVALAETPELSETEHQALEAIAAGEITVWPDLLGRFGEAAMASRLLEDLLGPAPDA